MKMNRIESKKAVNELKLLGKINLIAATQSHILQGCHFNCLRDVGRNGIDIFSFSLILNTLVLHNERITSSELRYLMRNADLNTGGTTSPLILALLLFRDQDLHWFKKNDWSYLIKHVDLKKINKISQLNAFAIAVEIKINGNNLFNKSQWQKLYLATDIEKIKKANYWFDAFSFIFKLDNGAKFSRTHKVLLTSIVSEYETIDMNLKLNKSKNIKTVIKI